LRRNPHPHEFAELIINQADRIGLMLKRWQKPDKAGKRLASFWKTGLTSFSCDAGQRAKNG
jgi:hypothetical protein